MIALGTSSWSFDGWRGVFYPEALAKNEQLTYYARQFVTVEVNTSFYGLPTPTTLIKWVESVPPGFTFALKFPKRISHEKRLVDCEAETVAFINALHALGDAAGPAFLQLPPNFTREREGRELATYLERLAIQRGNLRMAVEVRSEDLMTSAFARFLADHSFAFVIADRKGTPDLYDLWAEVGVNTGLAMIRWIGDDRNGPEGDRELVAPQDAKLGEWAVRLLALESAGMDVFGYVHNPYEGHSPATVRRLQARIGQPVPVEVTKDPPKDLPKDLPTKPEDDESAQMRLL